MLVIMNSYYHRDRLQHITFDIGVSYVDKGYCTALAQAKVKVLDLCIHKE